MVNEQMITHWSGDAGQHWAAEQERYDRMLAGFAWLVTAVKPR